MCWWYMTCHVFRMLVMCWWYMTCHVFRMLGMCWWYMTCNVFRMLVICWWYMTCHVFRMLVTWSWWTRLGRPGPGATTSTASLDRYKEIISAPQHCFLPSFLSVSWLCKLNSHKIHYSFLKGDTKNRRIPTPIMGTGPTGHNIVMVALGAKVRGIYSS